VQKKEEARIAQERKDKKWQKDHAYDELFTSEDLEEANSKCCGAARFLIRMSHGVVIILDYLVKQLLTPIFTTDQNRGEDLEDDFM
jgi:hypothetical protein